MRYKRKKSYWQQAIRGIDYLKTLFIGLGLLFLIAYLFYGSIWAVFFLAPLLFLWFRWWETSFVAKKRFQFQQQFKDAIQAISTALNVGYSVENAWREAEKEMQLLYGEQALICREFQYMVRQLEMNVTLESVLAEFAERTKDEEVETFATVFTMAKRSGGNMIEIIRTAVTRISEKVDMKREMETVISSKKMEFRIMAVIPLAMICYMKISFGEFINILYGNLSGIFIMTICLVIYLFAYMAGKKMVEIEV